MDCVIFIIVFLMSPERFLWHRLKMAKQSEAMEILFHEVSCYLTSAGQILNKEWTFKIFQCEWLNKKTVQG